MEAKELVRFVNLQVQAREEREWARICEIGEKMRIAMANEPREMRVSRRSISLGRVPAITGIALVGIASALAANLFFNLPADEATPNQTSSTPRHLSSNVCYMGEPNNYFLTGC